VNRAQEPARYAHTSLHHLRRQTTDPPLWPPPGHALQMNPRLTPKTPGSMPPLTVTEGLISASLFGSVKRLVCLCQQHAGHVL